MPRRITEVLPQKKKSRRFNVFIDGEYAFSLSSRLAAAIQAGGTLSEQQEGALKREDEIERAFDASLNYLKYRPRSRVETSRHLEGKGFEKAAIETALKRLEHYAYIDDFEFARFWVESRTRNRPRGLFALKYELREKGIEKHVIEKTLAGFDEHAPAWQAVAKKLSGWSTLPDHELKGKIYSFLKQRGFAFETCEDIWNRAREKIKDEILR